MPRNLGVYEGQDVVIGIGRFGPYAKHGNLFASLGKENDPYTVDLTTAIELIEAKKKAERERIIKVFEDRPDVQLLKGRWGPYLVVDGNNYRLPKDKEAEKPFVSKIASRSPKILDLQEVKCVALERKQLPRKKHPEELLQPLRRKQRKLLQKNLPQKRQQPRRNLHLLKKLHRQRKLHQQKKPLRRNLHPAKKAAPAKKTAAKKKK